LLTVKKTKRCEKNWDRIMAGWKASNIPSLFSRLELQKSAIFFIRQTDGLAAEEFYQ
jgi:hypothetical protein